FTVDPFKQLAFGVVAEVCPVPVEVRLHCRIAVGIVLDQASHGSRAVGGRVSGDGFQLPMPEGVRSRLSERINNMGVRQAVRARRVCESVLLSSHVLGTGGQAIRTVGELGVTDTVE